MNNTFWTTPQIRKILNWAVIVGSITLCALILPTRIPGMELLGISPNWLLIWVVAWSIKRTIWQGAVAGLALGFIQDGLTSAHPSHVFALVIVGVLTACLHKQRYIQEDFISVALIVFAMAFIAETVRAFQFTRLGDRTVAEIWLYHQQVALSSAILSSLWAPVLYFPLSRWWHQQEKF